MRWLLVSVLYTALAFGANAGSVDMVGLEALREGSMKKLTFLSSPAALPATEFTDAAGGPRRFEDWRGKVLLVNFWATWCAPCRKELPALDRLGRDLGGEDFAVLTIATGRNPLPAITRLFEDVGVTGLPVLLDPKMDLARDLGVLGLPVTLIVDREGREIARMTGDAEWDGASARAIITALLAAE
ncbi:TlpA disulfide reductase family protein [Albidovulum sp.]